MFEQLNIRLISSKQLPIEHEQWSFGGLDAYTFLLADSKPSIVLSSIHKLKQFQLTRNDLFWLTFPRVSVKIDANHLEENFLKIEFVDPLLNPKEILEHDDGGEFEKKICLLNEEIYVEMSFGSLVSLGAFHCFETIKKCNATIQTWKLTFYQNHVDIDFQKSSLEHFFDEFRKRIKCEFIDNCAVINTLNDGFLIYINLKANCIDYYSKCEMTFK